MKVVIVGNGVAGITAARTLRERDRDLEIVVFSNEGYHYYSRPKLVDFLAGEADQGSLFFYPDDWYRDKGIEVHLNQRVASVDTARHIVELADRSEVSYDRLVLANGSVPNVPPFRGVDQQGVFTLRSLDDALKIKRYARPGARALVVGGGLLGLESARALKGLGLDVAVLQIGGRLLPAQLDEEGALILRRQIETEGIDVVLNAATVAIVGNGRASGIDLEDGRRLEGELIIISAGVKSNVELAKRAGLSIGRGVVANGRLLTSADDVYAAGDVAEVDGRVYGIVPAAIDQARVVAEDIVGVSADGYHGTIPSNTLKVIGIDLTSVGLVNPDGPEYEELRWRDDKAGIYKKVVLQEGHVVGAILLGDRKAVPSVARMVREKTDVTAFKDRLLSQDFDLKQVFK